MSEENTILSSNFISLPSSSTIIRQKDKITISEKSNVVWADNIQVIQTHSKYIHQKKMSKSIFDPHHLEHSQNTFRGLIYLVWLCMIVWNLSMMSYSLRKTGYFVGTHIFKTMMNDIHVFLLAELVMCVALFLCPLIQLSFVRGLLSVKSFTCAKYSFEGMLLVCPLWFCWCQDWFFSHSLMLTLHTLSMLMKVHSYYRVNSRLHLEWKNRSQSQSETNYPENVTLRNFLTFLLIPTLIYQPSFQFRPE
jgi:hypothetical protein